ncbi:MAG TPA: 50S ribosomal protein L21e [Candidatus Nanoarchaeia archaeon]|nr:50S ribosomal protein L21e [Candidatus Nanoarchaeia archaeon]
MAGRKKIRERGKVRFSEYFKELKEGDKVALKKEQSFPANFKERMQGKTGTIIGKRGRNYVVEVNDFKKKKVFIVPPIHLKRIYLKPAVGGKLK